MKLNEQIAKINNDTKKVQQANNEIAKAFKELDDLLK